MSVAIILVEPENPDNIGAVARAMKNMGLRDLRLVKPVRAWKSKGKKLAVSAYDVLQKAKSYKSVKAAISDCQFVLGTTRRGGPRRGDTLEFDAAIHKVKKEQGNSHVGLMFGRESKGLDNEALKMCDKVMAIPVHPDMPSVNLAQAVMICCFSIFDHSIKLPPPKPKRGDSSASQLRRHRDETLLPKGETRIVLSHFEKALKTLGFTVRSQKVERIRESMHRILKRSGLYESEAQMLKGLSRRIYDKLGNK